MATMDLLKEKYANMVAYLEAQYPGEVDTAPMRAASLPAIVAAVRTYLAPHYEALTRNDLEEALEEVGDAEGMGAFIRKAAEDEKLRRYAILFIELCA